MGEDALSGWDLCQHSTKQAKDSAVDACFDNDDVACTSPIKRGLWPYTHLPSATNGKRYMACH
jgi:hypothetical protein